MTIFPQDPDGSVNKSKVKAKECSILIDGKSFGP